MNLNGLGQRRTLVAILSIGVVLIGLSAVVDSPVADAAPELFAGLVVLVVAGGILRVAGARPGAFVLSGIALAIGGAVVVYTGLATLAIAPQIGGLERVGDVALVVGLILLVYDRRLWERFATPR